MKRGDVVVQRVPWKSKKNGRRGTVLSVIKSRDGRSRVMVLWHELTIPRPFPVEYVANIDPKT
jgi:hypothetical protein